MVTGSIGVALRRLTGFLVLATSASAFTVTALWEAKALDWWVYPGSQCVRWGGPEHPGLSQSTMYNPSNDLELRVDCPVIVGSGKRYPLAGSVLVPRQAWVDVIDTHKTADVRCSLLLVNFSSDGVVVESTDVKSSSGFSDRPQRLQFNDLKPRMPTFSHSFFSCRIPPRDSGEVSRIVNYVVDIKDK